jgi:squalene-hopene/tetraprenyl-beta-curcumene cyclase
LVDDHVGREVKGESHVGDELLGEKQPVDAGAECKEGPSMTASTVPLSHLRPVAPPPSGETLRSAVARARDWLLARQQAAGHWCGELEGDTTLESYIILLEAFFGRLGTPKTDGLARTIRAEALPGGGWAQFPSGPADLSVTCLSYLALKVAGDEVDAPHMSAARAVIARAGGIGRANSYTRYHLALFGQIGWDEVPAIPPEMLFLPDRSPFTVYDMSSWSRTIFVPLSILYGKRAVCRLPPARGVAELLEDAARLPAAAPAWLDRTRLWAALFEGSDRALKLAERLPGSSPLRRAAIDRAAAWMIERLEGSDGLSAILPAMVNSVLALRVLGYAESDPLLRENLRHLDDLVLASDDGELRVQPCVSPVWDTVLAAYALSHAGLPPEHDALARAATWLVDKQTRVSGDWARRNPAAPGGWYFEHRNPCYPDVDDTCMALMVLRRARARVGEGEQAACVERGLAWMLGMQNADGGFASFDRDNDKEWLTHVPFADHNAMIDPSTADITGRVLECLAHFPRYDGQDGRAGRDPVVSRALEFLKRDQDTDGSWYGRWGVNHIYGTWQALRGLAAAGEDQDAPYVRRAVSWLRARQNDDGGWGESIASYTDPDQRGVGPSTPSQTAWAVMGLLVGAGPHDPAVERGVRYLVDGQDEAGTWEQALWTGTGFPRVFYLNYHLYRHTFPLMALGQYAAALGEAS